MYQYSIQQRIRTLAKNAADIDTASFEIFDLKFSQWEFNYNDGWLGDAWLAESVVLANSIQSAYVIFYTNLSKIIPRISLIGQTFISSAPEPFLIQRKDKDFGFVNYVQEDSPVGLMFMHEQRRALDLLLASAVADEFFYYWNDAVNTTGYTAKVLLMAAAVECLIKKSNGAKDLSLRKKILGNDLEQKIFGQRTGLRHRLSHGEYLGEPDGGIDYVVKMHNKVIEYFNKAVLLEDLLSENVTSPQRNFVGNHSIGKFYVRPTVNDMRLCLKDILLEYTKCVDEDRGLLIDGYDYVHGAETKGY